MATTGVLLSLAQPALSITDVFASPNDITDSIRSLEEETESIQSLLEEQSVTLDEIMEMIANKEEDVMVLIASIEEKQEELSALQADIDTKHGELDALTADIEDTQDELDEAVKRYEKNREVAKKRFQSLQTEEQNALLIYVEAVMHSESFMDIFGRINAVSRLLGAHGDLIRRIQTQADTIQDLKDDLRLQKRHMTRQANELEEMEEEVRSEQEALLAERKEAETLIDVLSEEREAIELEYAGNVDALSRTQETLDGQRLLQEMMEAEERRQNTIPDDVEVTLSSSRQTTLNALSRVREGQRDTDTVEQVISRAEGYMGVPYVWGGTTPSGFDCSGLVQRVYGSVGISLPRTSAQQATAGSAIAASDAQPGDLLFWDRGGRVYHVAIYIGGGEYIHAPRPGKSVGITSVLHFTPSSARRVIPNKAASSEGKTAEKELTASLPAPAVDEPSDNANLLGSFEATAYAIGDGLTPSTTTANGTNVANTIYSPEGHRIIAVDTDVIPMNTVVRVELPNGETFTAKASDTGSAINGHKIDLLMSSPDEAIRFGRQRGINVFSID